MIDINHVYTYRGYNIHQERDKEGNLRETLVIVKNNEILANIVNVNINDTIANIVKAVEKIIDDNFK